MFRNEHFENKKQIFIFNNRFGASAAVNFHRFELEICCKKSRSFSKRFAGITGYKCLR